MPDIRIEDSRRDGGALTIVAETDQPVTAAALVSLIRQALREAGVR